MEFYEKLDFLMCLTNTTNSALSLHIKLDASYISRLRRGRRRRPKDPVCIEAMAAYFAKACKLDYQRRSLAEALKRPVSAAKCGELAPEIAGWLGSNDDDEVKSVGDFLTGLSYVRLPQPGAGQGMSEKYEDSAMDFPQTEISVYYGVEGKRCAVLYFLSEIAVQSKPRTLLLFSDEGMDWMTMDRDFAAQFAVLMRKVLQKGNKIKIIHTVSRDLDEMLNAINQWLPLYMTGLIEPYFYPKKRDGIFRRTLFIAAGVAAVVANSVGPSAVTAANFLFRNDEIIKAFGEEFQQYLGQCKPLMHIYTAKDKSPYFNALLGFEKEQGGALMKTEALSLLTMTRELETVIMNRLGGSQEELVAMGEQRREIFKHHIREYAFTEIIRLFSAEEVANGKAPLAFSEML